MAHQYTTMVLGSINVVNNVQPCRCSDNGIQRRSDVVMLSGYRPRIFFKFYEIKDNIINKPVKNYIILKCTINYNYLRHTIYSNMILLFKTLILKKHEHL